MERTPGPSFADYWAPTRSASSGRTRERVVQEAMNLESDLATVRAHHPVRAPLDTDALAKRVDELGAQVCDHSVFDSLTSIRAVRVFMEHHVWAVWDFMSLLKSIQAEVAPVSLPWKPPADPESARLINEIVVCEEGDEGPDGRPVSHFQAYVQAMKAAGAATFPIEHFTSALDTDASLTDALAESRAPAAARAFVATTFAVTREALHCRVAAFTLGREEVIPRMFRNVIAGVAPSSVSDGSPGDLGGFLWYLDRHVSIDGDRHTPMAKRLYARTCLRDEQVRAESLGAACRVLERRLALWDAVTEALC